MKRRIAMLVLVCLMAAPLNACTTENSIDVSTSLTEAEEVLEEIQTELAKSVKPEYFESDEWKAFVDAFWEGYQHGQEQMK